MARVLVLGAGISGHTAAMNLRRLLKKKEHDVIVVSPQPEWNWVPSNIWVGTGKMARKKVVFPLAPFYKKKGIEWHQAYGRVIHPEGTADDPTPFVEIEYSDDENAGKTAKVEYDYLVNATGPLLNFAATPGLGPAEGHSYSVCTADHAHEAGEVFQKHIEEMKQGAKKKFVVGTGHGTGTCQGAAFEYLFNIDGDLRENGLRDQAELIWITNEAELGDFGVGGMIFDEDGYRTNSRLWTESLFRERGIKAVVGAAVTEVRDGECSYVDLDGNKGTIDFDYAMLLPPFAGVKLGAVGPNGEDLYDKVFAPNNMMKVDAKYGVERKDWHASDWPVTYQSPAYDNIYAVGIAFAPPHPISEPRTAPDGTNITPAPPRTGMPSGDMATMVAKTIAERVKGKKVKERNGSMAYLGAACVASTGTGFLAGSAASMVMDPVVPNKEEFPETGRSKYTVGKIGLFGHWTKLMLHYLFIYKAKGHPFWWLIPG